MKYKKIALAVGTAVTAVAVVAVMVGFSLPGKTNGIDPSTIRTITLERGNLARSVSATGMVYSKDSTEIYSNLSYAVETVNVSVGDIVSEGDVLAVLDATSLNADISQRQATAGAAYSKAQQSVSQAQKALDTYQNNTANGNNSSLVSAESGVETAVLDVQAAELDVQAASNELSSARRELREMRDNEDDYDDDDDYEYDYDSQIDALRDAVSTKETLLEKAQTNLEKAQAKVEQAKTSLDVTKVTTEDSLAEYQDRVKSAQLSMNLNDQWLYIQKLQADVEKCTIVSPVSGVVTKVNITHGSSGSGNLFVIQNQSDLKIIANIKEYDIDAVSIGTRCSLKRTQPATVSLPERYQKFRPPPSKQPLVTPPLPQIRNMNLRLPWQLRKKD